LNAPYPVLAAALAASLATYAGGSFAIRMGKDRLHLILGFSAGAVVGVALFDLIPESMELATTAPREVMPFVALGFVLFMIADRFLMMHHHHQDPHGGDEGHAEHGRMGLWAASLCVHSLIDGLAIGLAFEASPKIGVVIAMAVVAHDVSDGINIVSAVGRNRGTPRDASRWLLRDAAAPLVGVALSCVIPLRGDVLGLALALVGGFFLYVGASDLLPESHHAHPRAWTTICTILGMAFMYAVVSLV
jgi:ZIP family zinc transporter